jgi:threonine dehydrogenase-like Zn-dependent dehydrogenase
MELHAPGVSGMYDRAKQAMMLESDRPIALRQANGVPQRRNRFGGGGLRRVVDKLPLGSIMNRSLTIRTGQTHVQRYLRPLLDRIANGDIDPSFVITHQMRLEEAPEGYAMFNDKQDECIKIVLKP